jgi:hypothetical protein
MVGHKTNLSRGIEWRQALPVSTSPHYLLFAHDAYFWTIITQNRPKLGSLAKQDAAEPTGKALRSTLLTRLQVFLRVKAGHSAHLATAAIP